MSSSSLSLESKIYGCWLGKSIGGTLGLPVEGRMERMYFSFYDPVPTIAPPNDDLELQLVWLHFVEKSGKSLTQAEFAQAWIDHIHYMWDEYGRCRWNIRRGVPMGAVGTFENPFHAAMGSPIRSEIWACLFPGDPDSAAHYAAMDASLDHGTEGIAGEVLFAVMQSEVAAGKEVAEAITTALRYIPKDSETARAVAFILQCHGDGMAEWDCWRELIARHGTVNFTYAPLNVALTIWALWYGGGDFEKSILLAVNGGYDTDCTAATAGATLGLKVGQEGIPQRWIEPIGDGIFVGPGILGIDAPKTLGELTARTQALIGKLEPQAWDGARWETIPPVDLAALPGTIALRPHGAAHTVPWANGELPPEVKEAGGATWTWDKADGAARFFVALSPQGIKLSIDGRTVLDVPAGLPYMPAPHRCPNESRVKETLPAGTHEVRVDLATRDRAQEALVILAYPNIHLAPWTRAELPDLSVMPDA